MNLLHGLQRWRSLLFVHWAVPVGAVRMLVPSSLEIDTFGDSAYVGLVVFDIPELRPARAIPLHIRFLETNLRTYVRHAGESGVWFFSLEAASTLAVLGARAGFGLPYFRADMHQSQNGERVVYSSRRRWPPPRGAMLDVEYRIDDPIPQPGPGSLEHFLVERYVLFAQHPVAGLVRGEVRHAPYRLRRARVERLDETLRTAAGIRAAGDRTDDWWCQGVDVEILPPGKA